MTGIAEETLNGIVADYNAGPGAEKQITVTALYQGSYDEAATKLSAVIQSGVQEELPDLIQLSAKGIFDMKESPFLLPLSYMVEADPDGLPLADMSPNALQYVTYQNELIGMPFSNSTFILYYNKDHFRAAGLDPEKPPKTLEEMAKAVEALTVKEGNKITRYGIGIKMRNALLASWIPMQGEGKYIFNEEEGRTGTPTKIAMTEDGTLAHLLTEWQKVLDTGGVEYTDASPFESFQTELYSMMLASTSSITKATKTIGDAGLFEVGYAAYPRVDTNSTTGSAITGSALYMMDRGDRDTSLGAWDFLKFIATPEASAKWFLGTGYYPPNLKAKELPEIQQLIAEKPQYGLPFEIAQDSANYPKCLEPWTPSFTDIDTVIQNEIILFSDGTQTLEQTIENIDTQSNQKLQDWLKANT